MDKTNMSNESTQESSKLIEPEISSASPEEPLAKRIKAKDDLPSEFSIRRRNSADTRQTTIASAYQYESEVPAWRKSDRGVDHKYDKYGSRQVKAAAAPSTPSTGATSDPRLQRIKRSRDELERSIDKIHQRNNRHQEEPEEEEEVNPYSNLDVANPSVNHQISNYHTFQSRITNRENKDINSIVRAHYNQRTQQSKFQGSRVNSPIYKLRNFNNAIKYMLLGNFVKHNREESEIFSFLDLCCGKGGDLNKCEFVGIEQYIGVDISDLSVREAYERYSKQKARLRNTRDGRHGSSRYNFEACFATGDCFTEFVPNILEPNFPGIINRAFPVDAVSIQFALHYAFESEEKVRTLLTNVTRSLRSGGAFIGTIPSSDVIKSKIVQKQYYKTEAGKCKFGNELYSVTFDKEPPADGVFRPPFGNKYRYWLKDAVDDVPEYVVPFETLRTLCEEYGLTLKYKKNFIDIFNQEIPRYFSKLNKHLIEGIKRSDGKYGAEGDEKEAVGFYIGFVFEKLQTM
ncbi:uncharacterized protein SPAPADRAFT_155616 [Spathaspora passalidarum NRRL Y-27907]|uniref:mRNA cap guanine-N(7) methyltransferase n=1 Tax=Spathaspora passalidarum (strain NRRL Y-27907 / 11-Y1) TaxID=619300 RepID=G3AS21_SPAPN|nr:uncharacterized protein SPAPADRAFT_155616 [Spathaspora passalidarum NRRL Y-27907]EGW31870.1 hypothetical protein SPAPADRAFT_155616 [Spathaspora passalidarum NRRL Y-27907]